MSVDGVKKSWSLVSPIKFGNTIKNRINGCKMILYYSHLANQEIAEKKNLHR